jgi:hypothetical protein
MDGYILNNTPWGGSFILEGSTDGISWDVMLAKSANNTFLGREGLSTSEYISSPVSSIYATNASGITKTGAYNSDSFSSNLLVAFPGDSFSDVSHLINKSTTAKTVTTKSGTSVTSTTSRLYGYSVNTFTSGIPGAIRFGDFGTNITTNNFTVEMWVNVFNTTRAYTPLFCTRPLTTNTLVLGIAWSGTQPNGYSPGALQIRTWANNSYVGSYNVTSNAWHHIAMTKSGTTYKVYLNGTLGLTSTITETIPGGTQFILGGNRAPTFGDAGDDNDDAMAYFNDLRFYTTVKYTGNFLIQPIGVKTSGYNSIPFLNTSFSIYKPSGGYIPPDSVTNASYIGTLYFNSIKECSVILSGTSWIKNSNTKDDFSVNCVASSAISPYWSAGTKNNCVVTDYDNSVGKLTFNVTPNIIGEFKFGIIVRNGEGTGLISTYLATSTPFSRIFVARTFTYTPTGTVYNNMANSFTITVSPLTALTDGNANIKVYYSLSNTDTLPTLCSSNSGTSVNASGVSTVSCTFPTGGTFYLYIGLSVDSYNLSSPAVSTIKVERVLESAVLLSRTTRTSGGWLRPDIYVDDTTARTFYDLTLGGGVSTYGYIAKFRDNSDPNLIYSSSMISSDYNPVTAASQFFFPSQMLFNSTKQFEWIKWGYTENVRPYNFHWGCGSYPEWQSGVNLQLWGYTNKDFVTGATLLLTVSPETRKTEAASTIQYGFTGGGGNTTGWSHYEIKNTSSVSATWAWAVGMQLQK